MTRIQQLLFLCFLAVLLYSCKATRYVPDDEYLLDKVYIQSTDSRVKSKDLRPYLKQKTNLKILGIVRFHLGIYNMSGKDDTKGVNKWLRKIGEAPVIYDDYESEKSKEELKKYLRNKGFTDAVISDTVQYFPKRKRAVVYFNVEPGVPYTIRNHALKIYNKEIEYLVNTDTAKSLIKPGMLFDLDVLDNERTRIMQQLRSKGYYKFNVSDIVFNVDTTVGRKQVDDTLVIRNPLVTNAEGRLVEQEHKRYEIKDIYYITDYEPQKALELQKEYLGTMDTISLKGRYFLYDYKLKIKPEILLNNTVFEPFQIYDYRKVSLTHTLMLQMPIIQYDNIRFFEKYVDGKDYLDCYIQLTQAKSQSFSLDLEGTNSNGNIGAAAKIGYQHRNLFKGAEIFNSQLVVGSETQTSIEDNSSFNSMLIGVNNSLSYPKFILPGLSSRLQKKLKASTMFQASYNFQSRPDYTRYISQLGMRYNWKGESMWAKSLSVFDFNYVGIPYMSDAWWERIKNSFERYSYEPHVISSWGFTAVYNDQVKGMFQDARYLRLSVETSGNILNGIQSLTNAGQDSTGTYLFLDVPISQYIKFDVDGVYNNYINEKNNLVYRLAIGVAYPYGNRKVLPFEKRYFAGGANSLRAWRVRSLGPGTFTDTLNINQLGDIKLEANMEYRFKLISIFEGALFVDAGNIWTIYDYAEDQPGGVFRFNTFFRQIALGYGAGLRMDMNFFVFRFDYGIKLHDPQRTLGDRWVYKPTWRDMAFNFAIGYPF